MPDTGRAMRRRFPEGTTAEDLKSYMAPFAAKLGFKFNTDDDFVEMVLHSEIEILAETGDVFCPCRVRTGDPKQDVRIVCPCIPFYLDDFNAIRKCWCGLFIRTDVEDGSALHGVLERPEGAVEVRLVAVDDMPEGSVRSFEIGKRRIALFRVRGDFYALSDLCKHWGAPLSDGWLDGMEAVCPWHGWRFDLRDGTTDHPGSDVKTWPVTVRGGEVFVTV